MVTILNGLFLLYIYITLSASYGHVTFIASMSYHFNELFSCHATFQSVWLWGLVNQLVCELRFGESVGMWAEVFSDKAFALNIIYNSKFTVKYIRNQSRIKEKQVIIYIIK